MGSLSFYFRGDNVELFFMIVIVYLLKTRQDIMQ